MKGLILKRKSRFLPPISFSPLPINKVRRRIHIKKEITSPLPIKKVRRRGATNLDSCGWCLMHPVFLYLYLFYLFIFYIIIFFYKDLYFEFDEYFSHSIPFKFFRLENFVVIWLIRVLEKKINVKDIMDHVYPKRNKSFSTLELIPLTYNYAPPNNHQ